MIFFYFSSPLDVCVPRLSVLELFLRVTSFKSMALNTIEHWYSQICILSPISSEHWPLLLCLINVVTFIDSTWLSGKSPINQIQTLYSSFHWIEPPSKLETWKFSEILVISFHSAPMFICAPSLWDYILLIFLMFILFSFISCCVSVLTSLPVVSFHVKIFCSLPVVSKTPFNILP